MFKRIIPVAIVAFTSFTTFAAPEQTITVNAGQGGPIVVRIPATPEQAPYALTGQQQQPAPQVSVQRYGQGDVIVSR